MPITIDSIYSYPVKGLAGVRLDSARIHPTGFANDRRFGIAFAKPDDLYKGEGPWRPWNFFISLKKSTLAAHLSAEVEGEGDDILLHLRHRDGRRESGNPLDGAQRRQLEAFLQDALEHDAPLSLVDSDAVRLWDDAQTLSFINLNSLAELSEHAPAPLHPLRFRANILLNGADAWAEEAWSGAAALGDCRVQFRHAIPRCAATTVHPQTAQRDCRPPQMLTKLRGDANFGIYAAVAQGGELRPGQELHFEPAS